MAHPNTLAHIASRVEQLLQHHDALMRANQALLAQVAALTAERDLLQSKHSAARARIDALLDRLHATPPLTETSQHAPD
jgi:uncharacterized protein (TIGR02449 family)